MNEDLFYKCSEINDYLIDGDEPKARDLLIQLLDYVGRNNIQYFPLLNSLIREVGLYPYMDVNSSEWEDAFVYNLFRADICPASSLPDRPPGAFRYSVSII